MMPETVDNAGAIPVRVFISYSWTSDDHAQWVLDLASRLRDDGVETILDRWHLKPGQDKYEFMEQMVGDPSVQKVLMICDKRYAEKANERKGGVGEETQIITPKVYRETSQRKFLPVIAGRDEEGHPYKPNYLSGRLHIDLSDPQTFEKGYEDLLRDIVGKPFHVAPAVGRLPSFLQENEGKQLSTAYKYNAFKAALHSNKPTAPGAAEDYLDALLAALRPLGDVVLAQGQESTVEELQKNILGNIELFLPYRDEFIEFVTLVGKWGSNDRLFDSMRRFFATASPLMFTEYSQDHGKVFPDVYQLLIPELFLYAIAISIKQDRFREANILLGAAYPQSGTNPGRVGPYHALSPYMKNIDLWQRDQPGSGGYRHGNDATVQVLRQRATRTDVTYNDLIETDYTLFIRSAFHPAAGSMRETWVPITVMGSLYNYSSIFTESSFSQGFPLFRRAAMHNDFENLCLLLNVADKVDFLKKFETACNNNNFFSERDSSGGKCTIHRNLTCLSTLDTV